MSIHGGKFELIDQAEEREKNAAELDKKAEGRMAKFAAVLESQPVDFDMSEETEDSASEARYNKHAHRDLKAILARAGAAEAKSADQADDG